MAAPDFLARMDADIRPPVAGAYAADVSPFGRDGTFRIALTTASVRALIPSWWKGRDIDFGCDGGTGVHVLFGGSSVEIVTPTTKVSTIAAELITFVAGTAPKIEAGTKKCWRVPKDAAITHFCWFGVSAAGYIEAVNSTGDGAEPAPT